MKKAVVGAAIIVLLSGLSSAEEPPSWLNRGNLDVANTIYDILEVPETGVLLAGGSGWMPYYFPGIWRSTNAGASWSVTLSHYANGIAVKQLVRDSATGRIWAAQTQGGGNPQLYYSDDTGQTWTGVSVPCSPYAIEVVGDYLYYGGGVGSPYSICLYRLSQDSLKWETLTQYIECSAITRLKYRDGKLLVFAADQSVPQTRVFTYTP